MLTRFGLRAQAKDSLPHLPLSFLTPHLANFTIILVMERERTFFRGLYIFLLIINFSVLFPKSGASQALLNELSEEEFRAIARAQLETLHYQIHIYRNKLPLQGGLPHYPKNFAEFAKSPFYVIEVFNMFTGEPIREIAYVPRASDFVLEDASIYPGGKEEVGSERTVGLSSQPPTAPARKIDPTKVLMATPGDLLYYADGDILQLVIFGERGLYEELFLKSPFNFLAEQIKLTENQTSTTDFLIAEVATHLELMLPKMVARKNFILDSGETDAAVIRRNLKNEFQALAGSLFLLYINPAVKDRLKLSETISLGDIANASWLSSSISPDEIYYFMEGTRVRSLAELTDASILKARKQQIQKRDAITKAHLKGG